MNRSFSKIVKSCFLSLLVLFIFVPKFVWGNPAEIPYRLDKATAGLVGDVHAEICVLNNGISIEAPPSDSQFLGRGLGADIALIKSIVGKNVAEETIVPLREMIKDIDFRAVLQAALLPMVKELSWPRIIDLQARDGAALSKKKDILLKVNEGSFLDIYSSFQLSPNAEVLRILTGFTLYLKGSAKAAVAGRVYFSSARIGKFEVDDDAIALWAGDNGAAFRQALNQGIEDTVKMLNCILLNAGGKTFLQPDSKFYMLRIRTEYGEGSSNPKKEGKSFIGLLVEENENRVILQTGSDYFSSIPRSDILAMEMRK
jgi:hypothetical protein